MSAGLGRVGIRQRSAFVMACVASALFVAAVSMIASQIPSASRRTSALSISAGSATRTTRGKGLSRRSFHFEIVPCGSASTNATRSPFSIAATASPTASVLLPLPPFCVTRARTYMSCASPDDNDVKRKSRRENRAYDIGDVPLHVVSRIKGERGTHNQSNIHPPRMPHCAIRRPFRLNFLFVSASALHGPFFSPYHLAS